MLAYALIFILMTLGFAGVSLCNNLMKKLMALNIMQVSIIILFIALAYKSNAHIPIAKHGHLSEIINPLPHALMLTAIVVGVATTGLAISLLIRIKGAYGNLNEDHILDKSKESTQ